MTAFEHILLLLSFVYALAIAHFLSNAAALIRESSRVRFSLVHALWAVTALLIVIASWMSFWDLRALPSWSVATIFFTFILGFCNYLGMALVCPEIPATGVIDLAGFHQSQGRKYIGACLVNGVVALIANYVYGGMIGVPEWNGENLATLPMTLIILAAFMFRARWVQTAAPLLMIPCWIFYFTELQGALK